MAKTPTGGARDPTLASEHQRRRRSQRQAWCVYQSYVTSCAAEQLQRTPCKYEGGGDCNMGRLVVAVTAFATRRAEVRPRIHYPPVVSFIAELTVV